MAGKYRLRKEAKDELIQAAEWYESQQQGIGEKFFNEALEKIEDVADKPNSHSPFHKEYRRASLYNFPYWIVYIIKTPIILVLSVWHKKRNPDSLIQQSESRDE